MMLYRAINSLRPNVAFSIENEDIKSIVWHEEGVTTPTKKQIDDEIKRLEAAEQAEIAAKEAAKASAIAKLEALGLNLEEAKAIFG